MSLHDHTVTTLFLVPLNFTFSTDKQKRSHVIIQCNSSKLKIIVRDKNMVGDLCIKIPVKNTGTGKTTILKGFALTI